MPKILIVDGFVFLLFASDVAEKRRHIHLEVRKGRRRAVAKFWLEPHIELVSDGGLPARELAQARALLEKYAKILHQQLDKFYAGLRIKVVKK